jgi:lipopolysaccharide export system permease protein
MRLGLKRLHVLLLRSFVGPFALTFFIVIFIMVMQFLFKYINDLIGKGLEFPVVSEFLLYTTASMVPMALPLAILMAALITFGNLGEYYELTAMKSSGISLVRIMMPLIFLTLFMSIGAFIFANNVLPVANLKMRSLLYDIQRKRPSFQIMEGIFYNGIEGYSMRIDHRDLVTNMLYGVRIYDHIEKKGNTLVTIADSGYMKVSEDDRYLVFTLFSGRSYADLEIERKNRKDYNYPFRRDFFQEQTILIELTGFGLNRTDESLFKSHYSMMSLSTLHHYEDSLGTEIDKITASLHNSVKNRTYYNFRRIGTTPAKDTSKVDTSIFRMNLDSLFTGLPFHYKEQMLSQAITQARATMNNATTMNSNLYGMNDYIIKYQIEVQRKYTLSLACLIFFFIGAPLGAIIRKGGLGMPTVISVLFFLAWYVISMSGEQAARDSAITPFAGMWLSTAILLPIGIWLTYKSMTDAALMNVDTYSMFFRKIRRRLRYVLIKYGLTT